MKLLPNMKGTYKGIGTLGGKPGSETPRGMQPCPIILTDIATLGIKYDQLTYTSDYFPLLLEQAELLIKAGVLYADDTPVEQMREERMAMKESKCRSRSIEENLQVVFWANCFISDALISFIQA
eukprot:scaffold240877_cov35-Prasinocladus_malaysianus.AAC.1